jgi:hypothetical protein
LRLVAARRITAKTRRGATGCMAITAAIETEAARVWMSTVIMIGLLVSGVA